MSSEFLVLSLACLKRCLGQVCNPDKKSDTLEFSIKSRAAVDHKCGVAPQHHLRLLLCSTG